MKTLMKLAICVGLLVLLPTVPAQAQLNGSHTLGDYGVQSGSQAHPGLYAGLFYYHYTTDTVKNGNGVQIQPNPDQPGSVSLSAVAPLLYYVSKTKVLGANYGAMIILAWANGSLEAPGFGLSAPIGTAFGDMVIRPIELGWHSQRMDVTTGFQFYAPTGKYTDGATDNVGKGMWTYEPFVGATAYFDQKRTVSFATTAFWEVHGEKKDSATKVGQILTLEGGLGKSYMGGGVVVGLAYYAQWKLTRDQVGLLVLPDGTKITGILPNRHEVYAVGPDVTLPIASKSKLYALVNVRYFWEFGARSKTQGQTLTVMATFPIPSVKLH